MCKWIPEQKFDFVYFNVLHDSWYYSIKSLNARAKFLINEKYYNYTGPYADEIHNLLRFMNQDKGSDCSKLVEILKQSDIQRGQKFSDHHKEMAIAIDYE